MRLLNLIIIPLIINLMQLSDANTVTYKNKDIYIVPKSGKYTETVIFLHGLGDSAQGWYDIFVEPTITPCLKTTKVVLLTAPIAPVTINGGAKMTSWYDIKVMSSKIKNFDPEKFPEAIGVDEIASNTERINAVLNEEIKLLGGDSKRVAIGGFSQGCAMALNTGLQFDQPLAGIFGWSGYLFPVTKLGDANAETPILLSHGFDDGVIPFAISDASYKRLDFEKHQIVKLEEKGLAHSINQNVLQASGKFMQKIFGLPSKL